MVYFAGPFPMPSLAGLPLSDRSILMCNPPLTMSSDNESIISRGSSTSSGTISNLGRSRACTSPKPAGVSGLSKLQLQSCTGEREVVSPLKSSPPESKPETPPLKRKRPPKLELPVLDTLAVDNIPLEFEDNGGEPSDEISVAGQYYAVYCKRGRTRVILEDSFQALPDIGGDTLQAAFGVYDGHGGRRAVEYASQHLATNIVESMATASECGAALEDAVKEGYLHTDREFLKQGVSSGASCVTAVVRGGHLIVANAGDCRAVLSRGGVAEALSCDHRASRQDEQERIERLGGYVDCDQRVPRVQGVLAVSRGLGDIDLKEYITAEPDVSKHRITLDCEFVILASDGLWDVVSNDEAVRLASSFFETHPSNEGMGTGGGVSDFDHPQARSAADFLPQGPSKRKERSVPSTPRAAPNNVGCSWPGATYRRSLSRKSMDEILSPRTGAPLRVRAGGAVAGTSGGSDGEDGKLPEERKSPSNQDSGNGVEQSSLRTSPGEEGYAASSSHAAICACRKLVETAVERGTPDDVSVMIFQLERFHPSSEPFSEGACPIWGTDVGESVGGRPQGFPLAPPRRLLTRCESGARLFVGDPAIAGPSSPMKRRISSIDFDEDIDFCMPKVFPGPNVEKP